LQALDLPRCAEFFLRGDFRVFSGGFEKLHAKNVVFWVVNVRKIVVKVWWKTPSETAPKNTPRFEYLFLVGPLDGLRFGDSEWHFRGNW
jgi:hypothetical protein